MKRLLTSTACSIPLAFASIAYAQTTPPPASEPPPVESTTPGTTGVPAAPGAPGADTGTMGTAPSGAMDSSMTSPATGDTTETISGLSVKKMIGESVHNENDEKVGDITDVILGSDGTATNVVIGAGGFLGMGQHDVAIPFDEIQRSGDRLTLSGYTKDQLKALPKVEVSE